MTEIPFFYVVSHQVIAALAMIVVVVFLVVFLFAFLSTMYHLIREMLENPE